MSPLLANAETGRVSKRSPGHASSSRPPCQQFATADLRHFEQQRIQNVKLALTAAAFGALDGFAAGVVRHSGEALAHVPAYALEQIGIGRGLRTEGEHTGDPERCAAHGHLRPFYARLRIQINLSDKIRANSCRRCECRLQKDDPL
jgi:hypothetical protein